MHPSLYSAMDAAYKHSGLSESEIYFDGDFNRDRPAFFHCRREPVLADCIHRVLVEVRLEAANNVDFLRHAVFVDDERDQANSFEVIPSCVFGVFRLDVVNEFGWVDMPSSLGIDGKGSSRWW